MESHHVELVSVGPVFCQFMHGEKHGEEGIEGEPTFGFILILLGLSGLLIGHSGNGERLISCLCMAEIIQRHITINDQNMGP